MPQAGSSVKNAAPVATRRSALVIGAGATETITLRVQGCDQASVVLLQTAGAVLASATTRVSIDNVGGKVTIPVDVFAAPALGTPILRQYVTLSATEIDLVITNNDGAGSITVTAYINASF